MGPLDCQVSLELTWYAELASRLCVLRNRRTDGHTHVSVYAAALQRDDNNITSQTTHETVAAGAWLVRAPATGELCDTQRRIV